MAAEPPASQSSGSAPKTSAAIAGSAGSGGRLLGVPVERLWISHYYTVPWDLVRAGTPPVVMISCRPVVGPGGAEFAWHLEAEARDVPPGEIRARQAELEGHVLRAFLRYWEQHPKRW